MSPNVYVKLFGSILDSSIWEEDHTTVRVWIALLAMADQFGIVHASMPGLARRSRVTRKEAERAIGIFEAPDPDSRNPEHDGRRIEKVKGGWFVLNLQEYREIRTSKQVADAIRQQRIRDALKRDVSRDDATNRGITTDTDTDTEADTETEAEAKSRVVPSREGNKTERLPSVKMDLVPTRESSITAKSVLESLALIGQVEIAKKELLGWQIRAAFAYWIAKFGKDNTRTKLTHGRWARLEKYIKFYDLETCLYAIDGAAIHPHANQEGGLTFHEFPEIFMNKPEGPDRVEKYAEYARKKDKRSKHRLLEKHPELEGT